MNENFKESLRVNSGEHKFFAARVASDEARRNNTPRTGVEKPNPNREEFMKRIVFSQPVEEKLTLSPEEEENAGNRVLAAMAISAEERAKVAAEKKAAAEKAKVAAEKASEIKEGEVK